MHQTTKHSGLALRCGTDGVIIQLIRDDFDIITSQAEGRHFSTLFSKWHVAHAMDFLMHLNANEMVTDYQISLSANEQDILLTFSGIVVENQLLIVGTQKASESLSFLEQLQQINNEQANQIRQLIKNHHLPGNENTQHDTHLFEELSSLNNELVNLQRELSKKNIELARINEVKNQFLGIAAHDMRNPLGVIMAYAEFLLDDPIANSEKQKDFLTKIYSSASFLLKLIEDLLDISQIESGKLNLKTAAADLVELAEKSIALNNALAEKKQIRINLICNRKPVIALFDPHKIEQVFNNLLTNAVKYSHPNSLVLMSITASSDAVHVDIMDQGIGINPENLENIFIPFGKATNKGTRGEKSTGLGLSIVRKIIEGHGGSIRVESIPGKGSTFSFDLPKSR